VAKPNLGGLPIRWRQWSLSSGKREKGTFRWIEGRDELERESDLVVKSTVDPRRFFICYFSVLRFILRYIAAMT
jgi:hypothetical protein